MSILVKICKYVDFGKRYSKLSIFESIDFGQNSWKIRFWSKLSENYDLGQNFRKISILVNIFGKFFPKSWFWSKFPQNVDFSKKKNCQKSRFWSKFSKISIWVKNVKKCQIWSNLSNNLDFGQNCRKFSILVKI